MDRWISADIVTLDSEGHDLKLLEPNPNQARHEIRGESSCISMYFTCIFRYITVCLCLFRTCLILLVKDDKDD